MRLKYEPASEPLHTKGARMAFATEAEPLLDQTPQKPSSPQPQPSTLNPSVCPKKNQPLRLRRDPSLGECILLSVSEPGTEFYYTNAVTLLVRHIMNSVIDPKPSFMSRTRPGPQGPPRARRRRLPKRPRTRLRKRRRPQKSMQKSTSLKYKILRVLDTSPAAFNTSPEAPRMSRTRPVPLRPPPGEAATATKEAPKEAAAPASLGAAFPSLCFPVAINHVYEPHTRACLGSTSHS